MTDGIYNDRSSGYMLSSLTFVIIIENEEYRKIVEDTEEHISEYANQGLRTLCMAKRVIQIIL